MKLPELPPGCALDPGWTDDHHGHVGARKGNGIGNVLAKTTDKDELEALAAAQALREARIELWRDLYQRMTTAEQRIAAALAQCDRWGDASGVGVIPMYLVRRALSGEEGPQPARVHSALPVAAGETICTECGATWPCAEGSR